MVGRVFFFVCVESGGFVSGAGNDYFYLVVKGRAGRFHTDVAIRRRQADVLADFECDFFRGLSGRHSYVLLHGMAVAI